MFGNGSGVLATRFEISGYSSAKLGQKLQREKWKTLALKPNHSHYLSVVLYIYSVTEKSSVWNEPTRDFSAIHCHCCVVECILQTGFVIVVDTQLCRGLHLLIHSYSILQDIISWCRNDQIYFVAHVGAKI